MTQLKHKNTKENHIIVAIGASAGGLEAINAFFDHAADMYGYSFVIIQHLSAEHKSFLVELIAKHTSLHVTEAENDKPVEPGHVYVIPNKMMMTISEGRLHLLEKTNEHVPNNAIDIFVKSLAADQGENAIAVILSGTGSDGTKSIEYIKIHGGQVLVQNPATAKFDGMPNSAILSGNADAVLPPEDMPEWIQQKAKERSNGDIIDLPVSEEQMERIFDIVRNGSGHDFNYYKTPTIIRRLSKRMRYLGYKNISDYILYINDNADEAKLLSKELFINVTRFFRDKEAFDILYRKVIPTLVGNKAPNDVIKIWVCACSTGEEAYSIALLFDKYIQEHNAKVQVKIFATDIDETNVQLAAKNSYPLGIRSDIQEDILNRYFILENNQYSIIPRIRKQIVFAKHNVIKDPAFIKNDMVSCRNMLIYMNKILQEKILAAFHFSLNTDGYLFLGPSESIAYLKEGFNDVSSKWKLFRKASGKLGNMFAKTPYANINNFTTRYKRQEKQPGTTDSLSLDFQEAIIEDLGYTALYIDNQYEIKEAIGDFNKFLALPEKKLKLNLLTMLPKDTGIMLGNAVRRAWRAGRTIMVNDVPLLSKSLNINIWIKPSPDKNHNLTLVILGDARKETFTYNHNISQHSFNDRNEYLQELEAQLTDTRDNLQLAIEGLETTNEELQSANEELLSSNEELQSSNEELQSLNEELHTLNTEHQAKIKELIELNDDLDNYFKTSEIGQVFLDAKLNIRKFNPNAAKFINLIESDNSRPISHISNNLQYSNLQEDILQVQQSGTILEREIRLTNEGAALMRIYPYIRKDKLVDGVVLAFTDISDVKKLYDVVDGVFNSSLNVIIVLAIETAAVEKKVIDFTISAVNYAAESLIGKRGEEVLHQSLKKAAPHMINPQVWNKLMLVAESGKSFTNEFITNINGQEKSYELSGVRMNDGIMITYTDITQRKNAEKRLRRNYNELITMRESLKELNIHLEEEVASRTKELSQSEERFRMVSKATNDVIKDWDLVQNNVWKSESFYSLFGYLPEQTDSNIEYWFGKVHPDDITKLKKEIFHSINMGVPQWIGEYRFKDGSDQYRYVLERGYIMKDESGMPYRFISSMMDISALKKAEEATKELSQRKDEFMSIASHELKTPITSMKASMQIIERLITEQRDGDMAINFIRKANDQVDKLTSLVENLLDVTQIQSGKIIFTKSDFIIGDAINDCVYQVQNMTRHRIHVIGKTDIKIRADKNRIEQVIINLLSNAIKYAPDTTDIELICTKVDRSLMIQVVDKGIGIAKENINFVFERFYRGLNSSEKFSGLGLGLYISADIIRRHNGNIGVDSELGKGSTFWFSLPLSSASE